VLALVLARLGIPQWSGATYILIGPLQTVLGFKRAAARSGAQTIRGHRPRVITTRGTPSSR
jgi:hypothetical protein